MNKVITLLTPLFFVGCEASDKILIATNDAGATIPSDTVNTAVTVAQFLPTPWREVVCGVIGAALPGYIAIRQWQKIKKENAQ